MNDKNEISVYANGIVCCSVCVPTSMSREEIEMLVNLKNPTGISCPWKISENKTFADGTEMPCQCNKDKKRLHYLLEC